MHFILLPFFKNKVVFDRGRIHITFHHEKDFQKLAHIDGIKRGEASLRAIARLLCILNHLWHHNFLVEFEFYQATSRNSLNSDFKRLYLELWIVILALKRF